MRNHLVHCSFWAGPKLVQFFRNNLCSLGSIDHTSKRTVLKSDCLSQAVRPWTGDATSLSLSFLVCKTLMITVSILNGDGRLKGGVHIKCPVTCGSCY